MHEIVKHQFAMSETGRTINYLGKALFDFIMSIDSQKNRRPKPIICGILCGSSMTGHMNKQSDLDLILIVKDWFKPENLELQGNWKSPDLKNGHSPATRGSRRFEYKEKGKRSIELWLWPINEFLKSLHGEMDIKATSQLTSRQIAEIVTVTGQIIYIGNRKTTNDFRKMAINGLGLQNATNAYLPIDKIMNHFLHSELRRQIR